MLQITPTKLKFKRLSRFLSIWFQPNVLAYFSWLLIPLPKLFYQTDRYYWPQNILCSFPAFGLRSHLLFSGVKDSNLSHLLMKAPARHHLPLSFQRIRDQIQILLLIMFCTTGVLFYMVIAVLVVYNIKYAALTPEMICSRGPSPGDP